jgi:hypothetical protein
MSDSDRPRASARRTTNLWDRTYDDGLVSESPLLTASYSKVSSKNNTLRSNKKSTNSPRVFGHVSKESVVEMQGMQYDGHNYGQFSQANTRRGIMSNAFGNSLENSLTSRARASTGGHSEWHEYQELRQNYRPDETKEQTIRPTWNAPQTELQLFGSLRMWVLLLMPMCMTLVILLVPNEWSISISYHKVPFEDVTMKSSTSRREIGSALPYRYLKDKSASLNNNRDHLNSTGDHGEDVHLNTVSNQDNFYKVFVSVDENIYSMAYAYIGLLPSHSAVNDLELYNLQVINLEVEASAIFMTPEEPCDVESLSHWWDRLADDHRRHDGSSSDSADRDSVSAAILSVEKTCGQEVESMTLNTRHFYKFMNQTLSDTTEIPLMYTPLRYVQKSSHHDVSGMKPRFVAALSFSLEHSTPANSSVIMNELLDGSHLVLITQSRTYLVIDVVLRFLLSLCTLYLMRFWYVRNSQRFSLFKDRAETFTQYITQAFADFLPEQLTSIWMLFFLLIWISPMDAFIGLAALFDMNVPHHSYALSSCVRLFAQYGFYFCLLVYIDGLKYYPGLSQYIKEDEDDDTDTDLKVMDYGSTYSSSGYSRGTTSSETKYNLPLHHCMSSEYLEVFGNKFILLFLSWSVATMLAYLVITFSETDQELVYLLVTRIISYVLVIVWTIQIFRTGKKTHNFLKKFSYSLSRYRHLSFRLLMWQLLLWAICLLWVGIIKFFEARGTQITQLDLLNPTYFYGINIGYYGHSSLNNMNVYYSSDYHPPFGFLSYIDLVTLTSICYSIIYASVPPDQNTFSKRAKQKEEEHNRTRSLSGNNFLDDASESSDEIMNTSIVHGDAYNIEHALQPLERNMDPLVVQGGAYKPQLFCLETACLLAEASWQVYYRPPPMEVMVSENISISSNNEEKDDEVTRNPFEEGAYEDEEDNEERNSNDQGASEGTGACGSAQDNAEGDDASVASSSATDHVSAIPYMDLKRLQLKLSSVFIDNVYSNLGYISRSSNREKPWRLVVCFRGTDNTENFLTDLKFYPVPLNPFRNSKEYFLDLLLLKHGHEKRFEGEDYVHSEDEGNDADSNIFIGSTYESARMHSGFQSSYMSVRNQALAEIVDMIRVMRRDRRKMYSQRSDGKYTNVPIQLQFTGHSLGGALAAICGFDVSINLSTIMKAIEQYENEFSYRRDSRFSASQEFAYFNQVEMIPSIEVYTYGSPRVGDGNCCSLMTKVLNTFYRVELDGDWITKLPPQYSHGGHQVIVDPHGGGALIVKPTMVESYLLSHHQSFQTAHGIESYCKCLEKCFEGTEFKEYLDKSFQRSHGGYATIEKALADRGMKRTATKDLPKWLY